MWVRPGPALDMGREEVEKGRKGGAVIAAEGDGIKERRDAGGGRRDLA